MTIRVATADLTAYVKARAAAGALCQQPDAWADRAVLNVACSVRLSSDRTIQGYAESIWKAKPCPVP